jgi:hypothetical protein
VGSEGLLGLKAFLLPRGKLSTGIVETLRVWGAAAYIVRLVFASHHLSLSLVHLLYFQEEKNWAISGRGDKSRAEGRAQDEFPIRNRAEPHDFQVSGGGGAPINAALTAPLIL